MANFEGRGACDCCKKGVDVFADRNGMAYYNCGPCGFRGQHRLRKTSDAVLAGLDREAEQDGGPPAPPPAAPALSAPSAAAARVAAPPVAPKLKPAAPAPATQPKKTGFLANFTL